ncbi:MAG TPA: DUF4124 domain-containing protein [Burkholderiales bacterium]
MLLRVLICAISLAVAAGAAAQAYRWVDQDGKVRYGDTPPPGVKATPLRLPQGGGASVAPAAGDAASKSAPKGPLTPAEQEKEYRKRQADAQKSAAKADQEQKDAQARADNCNRAQAALRTLESGQRVMTTDAQGERYYLNEEEIARQTAVARQQVSDSCK